MPSQDHQPGEAPVQDAYRPSQDHHPDGAPVHDAYRWSQDHQPDAVPIQDTGHPRIPPDGSRLLTDKLWQLVIAILRHEIMDDDELL